MRVWAEALRSSRIADLTRDGIDATRKSAAARVQLAQHDGELPADQGLVPQTALDDGLDHDAFVRTLTSMIEAVARGGGSGKG